MKRRGRLLAIMALGALAACATQPYPDAYGAPGFFMGLLHGFVAWPALIVHIFNHGVRVYAFPNTGAWYDFGYLIGASSWGGAAAAR